MKDRIVIVSADRKLTPHEPIAESYRDLLAANLDADMAVHECTFIYYGPFTQSEAEEYAEIVSGHVHKLHVPVLR